MIFNPESFSPVEIVWAMNIPCASVILSLKVIEGEIIARA